MTYDKSYHHREEIKYNRSEWCSGKALAFKTIGRGFAPRQRFVFFTRGRRRGVLIYQSYYGREEIKYNRSEWCSGKALAFKTIGRGFALSFSHVDVGEAFQFINHISAVCLQPALCLFHTYSGVGERRWRIFAFSRCRRRVCTASVQRSSMIY